MKQFAILLIAVLLGSSACKPLFTAARTPGSNNSDSRIAFATFSARKSISNKCDIELIEFQLYEGSIKKNQKKAFLYPVEITLTDSTGKPGEQFQMEYPLIEDYEFSGDNGQLQRMVRNRDTARFYLRFNRTPSMDFIRFRSDNPDLPIINSTIKLKK